MIALQRRSVRGASVVLLAALLLVPIALSGHAHATASPHPCSVCAVTHHAPLVSAPTLPAFSTEFTGLVRIPRALSVGARRDQAPPTGRAPPAVALPVVA